MTRTAISPRLAIRIFLNMIWQRDLATQRSAVGRAASHAAVALANAPSCHDELTSHDLKIKSPFPQEEAFVR